MPIRVQCDVCSNSYETEVAKLGDLACPACGEKAARFFPEENTTSRIWRCNSGGCPTHRSQGGNSCRQYQSSHGSSGAAPQYKNHAFEPHVFTGSGKTSLILQTVANLKDSLRLGVIEADIDSMVDAEKVAAQGIPAVQLRTEDSAISTPLWSLRALMSWL